MVVKVATDEAPLETPSSDESGMGRSESPSDDSEPEANIIVPPDGGWGWVVVAASFLCNVLVDGIIFSGESLVTPIKEEFKISETKAAPVTSLLAGFYLLGGPFVSALANKYGFRIVTIAGSLISSAAISACYFAPNVEFLYFVYGIVGGIGFCMVYMPAVVIVGFYFEKWRAVATGLALCGSGVGTFIFAPLTDALVKSYGWRNTLFVHTAFVLLCAICGATFRPIKPVRVTMADESPEDTARKHEEAAEKLNSMMKLQGNLDTGKISMPIEMNRSEKSSPHTWMGVASNTRYPTAEEVFRGSSSHLNRRSSANSGILKNNLGKPTFIATPVAERDEQEDSNSNNENTEPLIATSIKVVPNDSKPRRSHVDLISRPLYRDDIFFGASLTRLPQYTSRSSLAYHLAVTHVPTKQEAQEERSGKCRLCPEAVKRTLATMLDVSLLKSPTTLLLAFSGFFTMLGYLVPFLYLKPRAKLNGMDESSAKFLVSAIGVANIIGRISCGMLSTMPKVSTLLLNNVALTLGGLATILCGFICNNVYQFIFCAIFGLAIASFASLRSILVVEYLGLEQLTSCYGLFLLFQGLGALMGPPIASSLTELTSNSDVSFYVAGCFIVFSAMLCYPINYVSRWEKARKKLTPPPKV